MKLKKEVKIGALAITIVLCFVWGVNFLKGVSIFQRKNIYYSVYSDAAGLTIGNPVKINGVKLGQIKTVEFAKNDLNKIIVSFEIDKVYKFSKNSIAQITSSSMVTSDMEMKVIIVKGDDIAQDGDTLKGKVAGGLTDMLEDIISPMQKDIITTVNDLDKLIISLLDVLNEENKQNISSSLESLSKTMANAEGISKNLNTFLKENNKDLNTITSNFKQSSENLNKILDSLNKSDLGHTFKNLNKISQDLSQIAEKINKGDGTAGQLVNDKTLIENLERATNSLDALLVDIKKNPKRYINVSVFGSKKYKESSEESSKK